MAYKSTKRSEQAANTKARIFAAAMDLFAENGVENVTISEIACQAHCSVGNIYHYFHNKEEIAACLTTPLDQQYQEFMDLFQHNPQYTKLDPTEKIISFFCEIVHITATGQFFASAINHGLRHPEDGLLRVHKGRI